MVNHKSESYEINIQINIIHKVHICLVAHADTKKKANTIFKQETM